MPYSQSNLPLWLVILTALTLSALLPTTLACEPAFMEGAEVAISNSHGGSWTLSADTVGTAVFVSNPGLDDLVGSEAEKTTVQSKKGKFEIVKKKGDEVYTIGLAKKTKIAVSNANGHTHLDKVNKSDSKQQYYIVCQSCTTQTAQACKITLKSTGECLTGSEPGDFVTPYPCNPRSAGQFWKLIAL
jgi:hypothetical protein